MEKLKPTETIFNSNVERMKTFQDFPTEKYTIPSICSMADAGFIWTGKEDIVLCPFCSLKLNRWNAEDSPIADHERHSPSCPHLRSILDPNYKPRFCCDLNCFIEPRSHVEGVACNRCKCYNYCKCNCITYKMWRLQLT